jgi:hypothetical protein
MGQLPGIRPSRVLVVLAVGGVFAILATSVTLAATASDSSGYQACSGAQHQLALLNSKGQCPVHDTKVSVGAQGPRGDTGPQGPSGITSMTQYAPSGAVTVTADNWAFFGAPPAEHFAGSKTAAMVTGTIDQADTNGMNADEALGICYQAVGGSTVSEVSFVEPNFSGPAYVYTAVTVSGVVGDLKAGNYHVGLCANAQSANMSNGLASVTIILAETAHGVAIDATQSAVRQAHPSVR